jgi:hypothetical protein
MRYPLSERMRSQEGRAARDFLDWLSTQNLHLARDVAGDSRRYSVPETTLVARFLGIDPEELAAERAQMSRETAKV